VCLRCRSYRQGMTVAEKVYAPQPGPQTEFLTSPADIVVYGGQAGGGKTWGLLFEPMRHVLPTEENKQGVVGFSGVIFRRVAPQIRNEGGLWDESVQMYPDLGGVPRESILEWRWPLGGQTMRFASMQHETDMYDWQGAQIAYIGFDELTHFTETQFFYLLSRNRSVCGVRPYIRATTNPDADSWVAELIAWWIDQDEASPTYGLAIPERAGKLRYFIREGGELIWADTKEELIDRLRLPAGFQGQAADLIKSLTFIPASVYDNKVLLDKDPAYLANLMSQSYVERARLLEGNWKVRASAGTVFNREWFTSKVLDELPTKLGRCVRYWDKAATDVRGRSQGQAVKVPFTVGLKLAEFEKGLLVMDVKRGQWSSGRRDSIMAETAEDDGISVEIYFEQEPGSGGKESKQHSERLLAGFKAHGDRVTGDKADRAIPASSLAEHGQLWLMRGDWNKAFIEELHNFPDARLKDQVDALSGAVNKLRRRRPLDPGRWKPMYQ
jgi:predicted phage terminase large subunit-like protein